MKPIIVSGTARSYTSLTMRLFELLGANVSYDKALNQLTEFNENGLYEHNSVCVNGTKQLIDDCVIKIILSGLYPNAMNSYTGVPKETIEKSTVLLCLREPKEIIRSVKNIFMTMNHNDDLETYPFNYLYSEYRFFFSWLKDNDWFLNSAMVFDTNDYFFYPVDSVMTLASVAGIVNKKNEEILRVAEEIGEKKEHDLKIPSNCVKMMNYCQKMFEYMIIGEFDKAIEYNWSFKL